MCIRDSYKIIVDKNKLLSDGIECTDDTLYLEFKNQESALLRPLWITGPYSIYVEITPNNYDERKQFIGDGIEFMSDLKPDENFKAKLYLNSNARVDGTSCYAWKIDLIAQFTVVTIVRLPFVFTLATTCLLYTSRCV